MCGSRGILDTGIGQQTLMMGAGDSMKRSGTGRVLAALFIGVVYGSYLHFDQTRWLGRGREAFLAAQSYRFDRFTLYHSAANTLIAGVILAAVAVGLYELIAAGA